MKPKAAAVAAEKLTIGRLAKLANVGVETIRYYERRGLIERPRTGASGAFRVYPLETKRRVDFIRRAKELGFTLSEIADLLSLTEVPTADRASLKAFAGQKVAAIEAKIRDLAKIQHTLEELMKSCSGRGTLNGCPIMDALLSSPENENHCGAD
jgi:Hg(II)-responsive transcriptional regulator